MRVALSRVLNGSAAVSADMDLRLSKALGTTPGSWNAMQADYDMWQARRHFRDKVRPITKRSATTATHPILRLPDAPPRLPLGHCPIRPDSMRLPPSRIGARRRYNPWFLLASPTGF